MMYCQTARKVRSATTINSWLPKRHLKLQKLQTLLRKRKKLQIRRQQIK